MMMPEEGRRFLLRAKMKVHEAREALRMAEAKYAMHERQVAKEVAEWKQRYGIEKAPPPKARP